MSARRVTSSLLLTGAILVTGAGSALAAEGDGGTFTMTLSADPGNLAFADLAGARYSALGPALTPGPTSRRAVSPHLSRNCTRIGESCAVPGQVWRYDAYNPT